MQIIDTHDHELGVHKIVDKTIGCPVWRGSQWEVMHSV